MDKMREEFEKWAVNTGDQFDLPFFIVKNDEGKYADYGAEMSWQAWQASRAALVVELPAKCETTLYQGDFEDGYESGYNECLKDAKENLLKAGIKCS